MLAEVVAEQTFTVWNKIELSCLKRNKKFLYLNAKHQIPAEFIVRPNHSSHLSTNIVNTEILYHYIYNQWQQHKHKQNVKALQEQTRPVPTHTEPRVTQTVKQNTTLLQTPVYANSNRNMVWHTPTIQTVRRACAHGCLYYKEWVCLRIIWFVPWRRSLYSRHV